MHELKETTHTCLVCGREMLNCGRGIWICPDCEEDLEQSILVAGGQGRDGANVIESAVIVVVCMGLAVVILVLSI